MQSLINKKGISSVVSTVLLILLVVAAVGIVWTAINRFVLAPQLSPQFSCYQFGLENHITVDGACYNATNQEIQVVLKRGLSSEFDVQTLGFVVYFNDGNSASWRCSGGCLDCTILELGNRKTYYFDASGLGMPGSVAVMAGSCDAGTRVIENC